MPQPSPRTKPSASASNVRHSPVRDNIPYSRMNRMTGGERMAWTPSGKGQINFALPEARSRLMHGHERSCAGHVERDSRPHEAERKRDPSDRHARGGSEIAVILACSRDQIPVFAAAQAGEHARAGALERSGVYSRVLKRMPARLEQHPLARVHLSCLDRLYAEEFRVKLVETLDEAASAIRGLRGRRVSDDAAPWTFVRAPVSHRFQRPP